MIADQSDELFHLLWVDHEKDLLYNYARDRDRTLTALGPRIFDTVVPGLSHSIPTTGPDAGSLSYQHLLALGNKATACSFDSLMSREERLKYANYIDVTCQIVEQSEFSPFSFLDHRSIDRLTRSSIDLKPHKKDWMSNSDKLYDPYMNLKSFENIVEAAASSYPRNP